MDDDLDRSNDSLIKDLISFDNRINEKLDLCRLGLQSTVDQISQIEHRREVEKDTIIREFKLIGSEVLKILEQRKDHVLEQLTHATDAKVTELLNRAKSYQNNIAQAAALQPALIRLQKFEISNFKHIQSKPPPNYVPKSGHSMRNEPAPKLPVPTTSEPSTPVSNKLLSPKPPSISPPPLPMGDSALVSSVSASQIDKIKAVGKDSRINRSMSVPAVVSHEPSVPLNLDPSPKEKPHREMEPISNYSKKRLVDEIRRYLLDRPLQPFKPTVMFTYNRNQLLRDLRYRIDKFGNIYTSTGSYKEDLKKSVSTGWNWVSSATAGISSMIWAKQHQTTELKEIPPPLLVIYLGMERALAEQFVEIFTVTSDQIPSGCVIPIIHYYDENVVRQWLSTTMEIQETHVFKRRKNAQKNMPDEITLESRDAGGMSITDEHDKIHFTSSVPQAPPLPMTTSENLRSKIRKPIRRNVDKKKGGESSGSSSGEDNMSEDNFGYFGHELDELENDDQEFRPVLRVCILLYSSDKHRADDINLKVKQWHSKYNLRSMSAVEMRKVTAKPSLSTECPDCYIGSVFHDKDGIVYGQETLFDSVAHSVFSSSSNMF